jgi:hypothetical protein
VQSVHYSSSAEQVVRVHQSCAAAAAAASVASDLCGGGAFVQIVEYVRHAAGLAAGREG